MRKRIDKICFILVVLLIGLVGYALKSHAEYDKILILNSYNKGLKWTDDIVRGVEEVLGNSAEIRTEYMDTKMYSDLEYYHLLYDIYRYKYNPNTFDAIILSDDNALNFYLNFGVSLFGDTPVIFCGVNDYKQLQEEVTARGNITGVREILNIEETIRLAISLHQKATKIFVISDERYTGRVNEREVRAVSTKFADQVQFSYSHNMTLEEIREKVNELDENTIVLYLSYVGDNDGDYYDYKDLADMIFSNTKAPVYSVWNFFIGHQVLGGLMTSGKVQGQIAGELTKKILHGENPANLDVIAKNTNRYTFDYPLLQKFNISLSNLPDGSIIENKPSSFYQENKTIVLTTLAFISILIIIIIVLLQNISRRKEIELNLLQQKQQVNELNQKLEKRVRERTKDLEDSNQRLMDTLSTLQSTQKQLVESEKMASLGNLVGGVAHEINTPIGICITAITYFEEKTKEMEKIFADHNLKKSDLAEYIHSGIDTTEIIFTNLKKASNLVKSFKKVAVDQSSLERRTFNVKDYLEEILLSLKPELKKTKIDIEIKGDDGIEMNIPPGDFSQIITNLVMNTIKHGYGKGEKGKIEITIDSYTGYIVIIYKDYGKGIDSDDLRKVFDPFFTTNRGNGGTGLGLNIVYNIVVQKLQGSIECDSQKDAWTAFTIKIPKEKNRKSVAEDETLERVDRV